MFGIGGFELFIILLFAFIVFGPDKLPEVARMAGSALAKFRKAQEEMNEVIQSEVLIDPEKEKAPTKDSSVVSRTSSSDEAVANKPAPKHGAESFAERKARHDKERAELQRAEEIAANRAAMREKAATETEERQAAKSEEKPVPAATLSAAELYGTMPMKPKPKSAPGAGKEKGAVTSTEGGE